MTSTSLKLAAAILVIVAAVFFWQKQSANPTADSAADTVAVNTGSKQSSSSLDLGSEAAESSTAEASVATNDTTASAPVAPDSYEGLPEDYVDQVAALSTEPLQAAAEVAVPGWTDDAFMVAAERLRSDPDFLLAVQEEFRAETDPDRLRRLSQLLAEAASPEVTAVAEDMLYNGGDAARAGAFDLLRRQQAIDPRVRDIAVDLLSYTTDEQQLVGAMNILATPAVALPEQHEAIIAQLTALSASPSADVRRQSLSVLGRWVDDDQSASVFSNGLNDESADVRKAAAYALVDYPYDNPSIKADLRALMTNPASTREEVSSALLAFESMPLSDAERAEAKSVRQQLDKR